MVIFLIFTRSDASDSSDTSDVMVCESRCRPDATDVPDRYKDLCTEDSEVMSTDRVGYFRSVMPVDVGPHTVITNGTVWKTDSMPDLLE